MLDSENSWFIRALNRATHLESINFSIFFSYMFMTSFFLSWDFQDHVSMFPSFRRHIYKNVKRAGIIKSPALRKKGFLNFRDKFLQFESLRNAPQSIQGFITDFIFFTYCNNSQGKQMQDSSSKVIRTLCPSSQRPSVNLKPQQHSFITATQQVSPLPDKMKNRQRMKMNQCLIFLDISIFHRKKIAVYGMVFQCF